jgi:hypothetical protein
MKWQDYLRDSERDELERVSAAKTATNEVYKATMRKLKNRCESRMRAEKNDP